MNKLIKFSGWLGFACMQGLTFPAIYAAFNGADTMPIESALLGAVGLMLLLVTAIDQKQALYIALNGSGAFFYFLLTALILLK